ncbi:PEP-CTERM sorting domain-containing protein [Lentisalinibacter salinarum]|uniref:PEP-CTERM sorting domain-containing protein n=1 Tax=Lentisalinibacter salinarum TaxID=2992239 RepID=UPI003865D984
MVFSRVLAACLLLSSLPASADVILSLDDGLGNSVVVEDGGANDDSDLDGVVVFNGALGDFIINVSTGISTPVLGSEDQPILDLNSVDVSSGAGSLTIGLTATGFTGPVGSSNFRFLLGGTTDGSVDASFYYDSSNTAFGTEELLGSMLGTDGAFSGSTGGSFTNESELYSMTIFSTITHGGGVQISSFDAYAAVPEPNTLALLGLGLLGAGAARRRKA